VAVIANYPDYFPPNFDSDFLRHRQSHFRGIYPWAFFLHIVAGPISLIMGLIVMAERSRARFPRWHRYCGRLQVACVLLLVTPSGLVMAYHAAAGPMAGIGLASLAIATTVAAWLGARAAMQRRFADHRRWMWRCYLLLCSAVVLRLLGGLAMVTGVTTPWFDPLATWISWLLPLTAFEFYVWIGRKSGPPAVDRAPVPATPRRLDSSV
jgi:uncharacterized membrane protein